MKYFLLRGKKPEGPFEPSQLIKEADFAAEAMVCPENLPPEKTKNWKAANKVKELKPWLRELAAKESATGLPWENDRTRLVGQTPPPKPSVPGLEPILPPAGPDAAERFKRPVEPRQPTLPIFKTSTRRVSNLAAGLASFSVVLVVGTLAMMLSGSCSGPTPDRTPKARKRYVVPANP